MIQTFQVHTNNKAYRTMLCDLYSKYVAILDSSINSIRDIIINSHESGYEFIQFRLNNRGDFCDITHTKERYQNYPIVDMAEAVSRLVNFRRLKFRAFTYDEAITELYLAKVRGVACPADKQYLVIGVCDNIHNGDSAILFREPNFGAKLHYYYVSDLATSDCNPEYSKDDGVTWQRCGVWD